MTCGVLLSAHWLVLFVLRCDSCYMLELSANIIKPVVNLHLITEGYEIIVVKIADKVSSVQSTSNTFIT